MRKSNKKRNILLQINQPMLIVEIVFIIFITLFLFSYNLAHYINERFEAAERLGDHTAAELESYKPLGFLVGYWQEHYEEMEFFYDDPAKLEEKEKQLREKLPGMTEVRYVTADQAESLDEDGQKLLAEVCYYELSESYDRAKSTYKPVFLTGFVVNGEDTFFLLTGIKDDEARISSGGEVFELGSTSPYIKGLYPMLDEILETGQPSTSMELSMQKGADRGYVHVFEPVYSDSRPVMYVGVSMQWKDLISGVLKMSLLVAAVTSILFMLLGTMFMRLLKKVVLVPIKEEQHILNEYKANKDAAKTESDLSRITSDNEIQELAEDFSSMVVELERHINDMKAITAEKERIEAELDMAKEIQESQLPSTFPAFPERPEFDIYATMTPAKEVGGDFYDFFFVDDDHLAMVMADVSGKGVPAALFMMMSKILINNYAMMGLSPAEVLTRTNATICENNDQKMFVTVWLGILEISTGKVTASNAGHEYPVIRQPGGKYELFKDKHGFVIGGLKGKKYKEYEFTLEKGGTLFVYTDGVPEATNAEETMFGTGKLVQVMNEIPDASPREMLKHVHDAVDSFVDGAPQFDDLTMLGITLL